MVTGSDSVEQLQALRPDLLSIGDGLIDDLIGQLEAVVPEYAGFLLAHRDEATIAAESVVGTLLEAAEHLLIENALPDPLWGESTDPEVFERIGRLQWQQGMPIGKLLAAYQLGARQAWRQISRQALKHSALPEVLAALAEAVFCFVDQLSSASASGYLAEQRESTVAREQARDTLASLLLAGTASIDTVRSAAVRAGWRLPNTAAFVLTASPDAGAAAIGRLGDSCLRLRWEGNPGAIVPDASAPGRRQRLAAELSGASAIVGHTVELARLPASARIVEIALRLTEEKVLTADPVFVADHLDAIIVHNDPRLLRALREQCLTPLQGLRESTQDTLRKTLRAWLVHHGDRQATAAELRVHPQTVRYRLRQLHELFGEDLEQPDRRLKLLLAVGWDPS